MAGTPRHNLRFDNKNNQFYKSFGTKVMESILAVKTAEFFQQFLQLDY